LLGFSSLGKERKKNRNEVAMILPNPYAIRTYVIARETSVADMINPSAKIQTAVHKIQSENNLEESLLLPKKITSVILPTSIATIQTITT
jgi:hypothetical protein